MNSPIARRARREAVLLAVLLLIGLFVVPPAIYWTGLAVFGEYAGGGFRGFAGHLWSRLAAGSGGALLLVFGPYLVIQLLRVVVWGARRPRQIPEKSAT